MYPAETEDTERESPCGLLTSDFAKHEAHLRGQLARCLCGGWAGGRGRYAWGLRAALASISLGGGGSASAQALPAPRPRALVTELPKGLQIRQALRKGQRGCGPNDGVSAKRYYNFDLEVKLLPKRLVFRKNPCPQPLWRLAHSRHLLFAEGMNDCSLNCDLCKIWSHVPSYADGSRK